MSQNLKKHGFSLVELAIVLVIIGLITGGILTGQDLIKASEVNSLYADTNKYKVAVNTFKLKYNALPGDMANATAYWTAETCPGAVGGNATGTCNGNGDGQIAFSDWVTPATNEYFRAWEHLSLAGLLPGGYTGLPATATIATAVVAGSNLPAHRMNGFFSMGYSPGWSWTFSMYGHYFQAYGTTPYAFPLTPVEAASIDSKFDDGKPGTGTISAPNATLVAGCSSSDVASTATYTLTGTSAICPLLFWLK